MREVRGRRARDDSGSEGDGVGTTTLGMMTLRTTRMATRHMGTTLCGALLAACAITPRPTPNAPSRVASSVPTSAHAPADTAVPPAPPVDSASRAVTPPAPPAPPPTPASTVSASPTPQTVDPTDGSGMVRWVGRDADRTMRAEDRTLLRTVFGIDDVRRLFLPANAGGGLRYASHPPGCPDEGRTATFRGACRVVGVRVGFPAPREPGETWDAYTGRVTHGGARSWAAGGHMAYSGLDALDPEARPAFERLITDARAAGFPVHVRETYRTPERQAFILARNDGRTTTATSAHSSGRAVDISVSGGRATHRTWVEFRRWVLEQQDGAFRLIGTPDRTWDWPHVEYVGAHAGDASASVPYPTVDALVAAARACRAATSSDAEAAERCTMASARPGAEVAAHEVDDTPARHTRRGRHSRHERSRGGKRSRSASRHAAGTRKTTSHHGSKAAKPHHAPKHRQKG